MKIRDIIKAHENWVVGHGSDIPKPQLTDEEARLAIYKAGLEAIPNKKPESATPTDGFHTSSESYPKNEGYNKAIEDFQKAWKQLCGIEGESDV